MVSPSVDRRFGVSANLGAKAPVRLATTAAIATLNGLLTVDGVVTAAGDRILVKDQSNSINNGIYVADTGDWTRDIDFNGNRDIARGTLVMVTDGATNSRSWWQCTGTNPITIGSSAITFGNANVRTQGVLTQIATASQTVFTTTSFPSINALTVYRNGQLLTYGTDYTTTGTTVVTMATGMTAGDVITFIIQNQVGTLGPVDSVLVTYTPAGTGAITTNVQAKLRESVSVLDFGADPTGVADSTAAIQAAIDSIKSVGGTVNIPTGTYKVNGLVLYTGISLVGSNARSTKLIPNSTDNTKLISIYNLSVSAPSAGLQAYITIKNLYIDGSATKGSTSNQHGIWIEPALLGVADSTATIGISNVTIENVLVVSMSGRGIHCRAQPYTSPALARYVQGVITKNTTVQSCGQSGLYIQGLVIECDFSTLTLAGNGATTSATIPNKFNSNLVIAADGLVAVPATEGDMIYPARISLRNGIMGDILKTNTATAVFGYITGGRQIKFDVCDVEGVSRGFLLEPHWPASPNLQAVKDVTFDTMRFDESGITRLSAIQIVNAVNVNIRNIKTSGAASSVDIYVNQAATDYAQNVYIDPSCVFGGNTPITDQRVTALASHVLKISQPGDFVIIGSGGVTDTCTSISIDTTSITLHNNMEFCIRNAMTVSQTITFNKTTLASATIPVFLNSDVVLDNKGSLTLLYDKNLAAFVEKSRATVVTGTFVPVVIPGAGVITTQVNSARYTKIDRTVTIEGVTQVTNHGTASGTYTITNLPYTAMATSGYVSASQGVSFETQNTGTFFYTYVTGGTTNLVINAAAWTDSNRYEFSITYTV